MSIGAWLDNFKKYWGAHDIKGVLSLFDKNVEYYETPFKKLKDFDELAKEWEAVKNQENIRLNFKIFSSYQNKHSVIWNLKYQDQENIEKNLSGTYLIELNDKGLCRYFHHCCELKK